jgi:Domain of unknown function (DUF4157)
MKTGAEKSSTTTSATITQAARRPFIARAGGGGFFAPAGRAQGPPVQMKMAVNKPGDTFEQEADKTADKVMRMPAPRADAPERLQRKPDDKLQRREEERILRAALPDDRIQKAPLERRPHREEEKIFRAALPDDKVQKKDDDRIQKAPAGDDKLQRREEERILRAALPDDKVQKKDDDRIQKAPAGDEKLQRREEERILRAALPDDKVQKKDDDRLQRAPAADEKLQREASAGGGTPGVGGAVQSAIQGGATGGEPISADVRAHMEPRFNADFSNVRIHNDAESASLSNQLSARAFTYQNHIYFSRDQYQPGTSGGQHLLAHELTHTIQQGHAVQRSPQVSTTATPPPIQRLGVQDALDYFADKALNIPGFRMLTVLLGFNPINMRSVDRNAANLLRALIELIPGGHLITQALDNHGIISKAAAWLEQKIAILGDIGGAIIDGLRRFIDSLSWTDIFDLGGVWDRAKRIFTDPIGRLIDFGVSVAVEILKMVKDAILKPLAALAKGTRGYDLLCAILGEDPISGESVPRTAETLLGGFMKLIGQEEIWENIKKGNAIARAYAWFQNALSGLMGMVRAIPHKIIETLTSLTFQDVITVVGAFGKIVGAFVNIAVDFISWGLNQVLGLLEIIFSVVAPGVMPYIKKAQAAFVTIIKNPIGFVGNLVRAGKQGFQMFASNILEHLKAALIKWIVGPLADAGVYIPRSFSLIEIVKLVLSVLGLTWQNIRSKLVQIIPEPVLVGLEKTAGILVTLVRDGPAAAWEQIKAELTELKDQLISQVTQMITSEVVKAAVAKLVTMLNPAGAVIQAIIAIYNTITFFIQKIQQIAMVVAAFIDSIAEIAAGRTDAAAKKVEQTMANALTVVVAFLAKFAGLGNIPEKVVGIVRKIRQPIDKGLDKIVAWLGNMLKNLAQTGLPADPNERLRLGMATAVAAVNRLPGNRIGKALMVPVLAPVKIRYGFQQLEPVLQDKKWSLRGQINPSIVVTTTKEDGTEETIALSVGDVIKARYVDGLWVATLVSITRTNVTYRFSDQRKGNDTVSISIFKDNFEKGDISTYVADKRGTFMGGNPPKSRLLDIYKGGPHYRFNPPPTEQIQYPRRRGGRWYDVADCDLSHDPIDAVTYWNTIGYQYGPRSPEVRAWMSDINNYIFEPSGPNRARGSRLGEEYRLPAKP